MNKIFAFIVFLFFSGDKIIAQTYHPFPDSLAKWSDQSGGCQDCTPGFWGMCYNSGYLYCEAGDTTINALDYTLIGYQNTFNHNDYTNNNITTLIGQNNNPIIYPGQIIGAIREDSTKKVWYRKFVSGVYNNASQLLDTFQLDTDILIYDFGLEIGDTANWKINNQVVQFFDSIQLMNGEYRKVWNFGDYYSNWIEGIGSRNGLFGSYSFIGECWGSNLQCFKIGDSLLLHLYGNYCDSIYIADVENIIDENKISIFPQPAIDKFIIEGNGEFIQTISLSDVTGKVIFNQGINDYSVVEDTNQFSPGIYIVEIKTQKGIIRKKIVID